MRRFRADVRTFAKSILDQFSLQQSAVHVGVIGFDHSATIMSNLSYDRAALEAAVQAYDTTPGCNYCTHINAGLIASQTMLTSMSARSGYAESMILLLTDGKQNRVHGGDQVRIGSFTPSTSPPCTPVQNSLSHMSSFSGSKLA